MTDFESTIIIFLSIISVLLFALVSSMPFKTDKDTKKLLKQICENTKDKSKPVKPVNITTERARVTKFAVCPICSKLISSSFKRCDNCGAEIDWSDNDEQM